MESNCDFIKEIDFYGKPPELYGLEEFLQLFLYLYI